MATNIPANLQEAADALEVAQQNYYVAYEKAHPDFRDARNWFNNFIKHEVEEGVTVKNPKFYASVAMDCVIAANVHERAARVLQHCIWVNINEDPEFNFSVVGPLRRVSAALCGGDLVLAWTFDEQYSRNTGKEVVAVLRIPVTPKAEKEERFSAPIGLDWCGAEFEYSETPGQTSDRFIVSLEVAALVIASSIPMLAAVRDLGECLSRCEGWTPCEVTVD